MATKLDINPLGDGGEVDPSNGVFSGVLMPMVVTLASFVLLFVIMAVARTLGRSGVDVLAGLGIPGISTAAQQSNEGNSGGGIVVGP